MDLHANVGDEVVVDAQHQGEPVRRGEVLEVLGVGSGSVHYRVRWHDGRTTIFYPATTAHTIHVGQRLP